MPKRLARSIKLGGRSLSEGLYAGEPLERGAEPRPRCSRVARPGIALR